MTIFILVFLLLLLEFGLAAQSTYTNRLRSSDGTVNLGSSFSINSSFYIMVALNLKNLNYDFSDGIHISGYISYSDKEKCMNETSTHAMGLQCRVSTWIMKRSSFSFSKTIDNLNCTNNDINIVYQNVLACYYGCAIMNLDTSEVYEYETVDLFKERYNCPMWVIYAAVAFGLSFIVVCIVCACTCCCCGKCCCPCLLCL